MGEKEKAFANRIKFDLVVIQAISGILLRIPGERFEAGYLLLKH